ncbi:MAG: thiol oxidoreductase [Myxococcales bacterium]|nr:thiol oxidoreductase [Myxococcales bacterium]
MFDATRDAFARTAPGLDPSLENAFFVGNSFFNQNWVTAPASAEGRDGLGPTFNVASCSGCHFKDGRGRAPLSEEEPFEGLLLRFSVAGDDGHGGPRDEPNYGGQFNHRAISSVPSEGRAVIAYTERAETLADGTIVSLRVPSVRFVSLAFGPMAEGTMVSARVAPSMVGLGLLEAVPEPDIAAMADPMDRDGDGISGRANTVWNVRAQRPTLGRFGWKANQPDLVQQTAGAFLGDIGITSSLFALENCPLNQHQCRASASGGAPEIDDSKLDAVVLYARALAVPGRRDVDDPSVLRGAALFERARCVACHVPTLRTGDRAPLAILARQTIHPYTDLLVHDMGEGLADGRPDYEASGREWRTAPLWGLGLVERVNRHTNFLHDGRARNVTEAILWHGGEAEASAQVFRSMTAGQRQDLLAFVNSL